jgi:hypothetical protein
LKEEDLEKIEAIIGKMSCPKMFKCADSGFEKLCKARDFGVQSYLDCLDENSDECPFALPFGDGYLCQCPLRVFLSKKLNK